MPLKEYMDWTEAAKSFGGATTEAAKAKAIGKPNQRPVKKGEWYYFSNHPKYPLKHPRESWQGENAVYMGKNRAGRQLWSGMGAAYRTEDVMYGTMVNYYNRERTERDYEYIVKYCTKPGQSITEEDIKKVHGNFRKVYMRYKNRILDQYKEGAFPDQITIYKLLNNPEYVLAGNRRKGGFRVDVGLRLNVAKVTEARNE